MANLFSDLMTNLLADPTVANEVGASHGRVRASVALVSVAAADDDGDIFFVERFKATDRILAVFCWNTAITAGTDYDLGFYEAEEHGSATTPTEVDHDALGAAIDMSSARDALSEADAAMGIVAGLVGKALWEMCAVAAAPDPPVQYDMALTANTVGTVAGSILLIILYTSGD
jgi:hypothetical protein